MRSLSFVALALLSSCVKPSSVVCDGRVCPEGTTCVELMQASGDTHRCVAPLAITACGGVAALDPCSYTGVAAGACYETTDGEVCLDAGCGNGLVDKDEVCDDGNAGVGDGCSAACLSNETCGNAIVDAVTLGADGSLVPNEVCDDGNALGRDACTSSCVAEQATWAELDSRDQFDPGKPPPRLETPLVYDGLRRRIVLFGGVTHNRRVGCDTCVDPGPPVPQGGTWESDGSTWVDMKPTHEPTAREGAAMAYDAKRRVSVLFGGNDGIVKNDTWVWNGSSWTAVTPATSPPARYRHGMAYDAKRKVVVVFGGRTSSTTLLSDTWEWDGTTWHQASPAASPTPEEAMAMAYDPVRGVIVMIGYDAAFAYATWEYDGMTWTQKATNDVTPNVTSLAFDAQSQRVLAYGFLPSIADGTWAWDGTSWTQVGTNNAGSYTSPSLVSDRDGHIHLFGGETIVCGGPGVCNAGAKNDTWSWTGSTWVQQAVEQPTPRRGSRAALDTAHGTIVMVGGRSIDNAYTETDYRETWEYDGFHWKLYVGAPWSAGKYGAAIAYDSGRDEMVVFGGAPFVGTSGSPKPGETWIRKNRSWTKATPATSPNELVDAAMAYDPERKRVVMFGGFDNNDASGAPDTWLWDGTNWTKAQPAVSPSQRLGAALAWDPIARELVLFGGESNTKLLQDTWAWDGVTWTKRVVDSAPPARERAQLTWNASRHALVLFGGAGISGAALNDSWEWSSGSWRPIISVNSPPVRSDHAQAALPDGSGVFAFGGVVPSTASNTGLLDLFDVWHLQWESPTNYEVCEQHVDQDGDGLLGCDDPDCWARCTPACPPGATCDANAPRCGDGTCNAALEDCRTCPGDCTTCTPLCGDTLCDPTETVAACPGDCTP